MDSQKITLCIKCKKRIPNDATYCPYCGTNQTKQLKKRSKKHQINLTKQKRPSIDLHIAPPNDNRHQINADLKASRIIDYKKRMGMSDRIDNVLYLNNSYYRRKFLFGKLGLINDQNILIDFEKDGLLFIGYTMLGHLSGHNAFIMNQQIKQIQIKQSRLQNLLIIDLKQRHLEFPIANILLSKSWQRDNFKILLSKYS
ncbi:hypothetical protein WR164_03880 [Philodulcilactobacillus myokoensis]|uniref:Zinc-ribbon domain-containing protein n=1 Tax=Philodulcilactobacillus myokoensis TaxID=2929573 RepID=A0A9W6B1I8_9LACO|nr:zinc ribbon domain-containing protein [Philodulcilactobacillus myokoensis]GLB46409.1 hypothetical protein WR164_03880 [Philodulcilactobacillus myokoensis]